MSWLSEMGPGFNWDLTEWYMENSHWEDPESWRKVSSITYVEKRHYSNTDFFTAMKIGTAVTIRA